MSVAEHLRHQAENCLHIARNCFDLASAGRMRLVASELKAKADEIERLEGVQTHQFGWNDRSSHNNPNN